jgi:hypothetical protein
MTWGLLDAVLHFGNLIGTGLFLLAAVLTAGLISVVSRSRSQSTIDPGWRDEFLHAPADQVFSLLGNADLSGFFLDSATVTRSVSGRIDRVDFAGINFERGSALAAVGVYAISLPASLPSLEISRKSFSERFAGPVGARIKTGYEPFDRRFTVRYDDRGFAESVLTPSMAAWLAGLGNDNPLSSGVIKVTGSWAMFYKLGRPLEPSRLPAVVAGLASFVDGFSAQVWVPFLGCDAQQTNLAVRDSPVSASSRTFWDFAARHIAPVSIGVGMVAVLAWLVVSL